MDDFEDDMEVDLNLEKNKKKSKVDGKAKGDRTELHLCKLLSKHFNDSFSRTVGSGNRWSQVSNMPEHAKQIYSGDIIVPKNFKWVIESKGGYESDMDAWNAIDGKLSQLDTFIEQVSNDAVYINKKPIICWKRNRKPWMACIRIKDLPTIEIDILFSCRLYYNDWILVPLEKLLNNTDYKFWFEENE